MWYQFQCVASLIAVGWLVLATEQPVAGQSFVTDVVASGLQKPTGIHVDFYSNLYYTEVPTPGVGGGANRVVRLNANRKKSVVVSAGDPNPRNLTSDLFGNVYWTCTSADVILRRTQFGAGATSVLLRGLKSPVGIDVPLILPNIIYFTEVPTPGLPGSSEGKNNVSVAIKLFSSFLQFQLSNGEPEPVDVAVGLDGTVYWTCRTAGVILMRDNLGEISLVESGLESPVGLDIDLLGRLYWTEIPTPGVSGANGGRNKVVRYNPNNDQTDIIHSGDPEPFDVTVTPFGEEVYWTCRTAGVILRARRASSNLEE